MHGNPKPTCKVNLHKSTSACHSQPHQPTKFSLHSCAHCASASPGASTTGTPCTCTVVSGSQAWHACQECANSTVQTCQSGLVARTDWPAHGCSVAIAPECCPHRLSAWPHTQPSWRTTLRHPFQPPPTPGPHHEAQQLLALLVVLLCNLHCPLAVLLHILLVARLRGAGE